MCMCWGIFLDGLDTCRVKKAAQALEAAKRMLKMLEKAKSALDGEGSIKAEITRQNNESIKMVHALLSLHATVYTLKLLEMCMHTLLSCSHLAWSSLTPTHLHLSCSCKCVTLDMGKVCPISDIF